MLYIVSLPIGNKKDITLRAMEVLKTVDLILCEDTRQFKKYKLLLKNITSYIKSYEDFSERKKAGKIVDLIKTKKLSCALVADSGTPGISDPGYILINECYRENVKVIPIPGVCAPIVGVSVCPFNDGTFQFCGFYSNKKHNSLIEKGVFDLVFFESPKRIKKTLNNIFNLIDKRQVFICREMTKDYENFYLIKDKEHIDQIIELGEFTFIIEKNSQWEEIVDYEYLVKNFRHLRLKDLSKIIGYTKNLSASKVYTNLLKHNKRVMVK